jgi:hypothetical protein
MVNLLRVGGQKTSYRMGGIMPPVPSILFQLAPRFLHERLQVLVLDDNLSALALATEAKALQAALFDESVDQTGRALQGARR